MGETQGKPFTAILHSTDASAGVVVPIYLDGETAALTLGAYEYVEILSVHAVSVPGGDVILHLKTTAANSPDTGKTIARGTVAANGGFIDQLDLPIVGGLADQIIAVAPAGVLDVVVKGTVRNGRSEKTQYGKPSWRESDHGQ